MFVTKRNLSRYLSIVIFSGIFLLGTAGVAQGPPAAPVKFTEARKHELRRSLSLTGSVASRRSSLVAAEVEGIVDQLIAREGDRVRKGAALVRLRATTTNLRLQAVKGQLDEAIARRTLATSSLERSRGLFEQQIISQQRLDDAVSEFEAWGGRVSQLEADVARLQNDLERTTVRAPFSGVVVAEHVAEGEWLSSGGAVVALVNLEDLEVSVEVPESYFGSVRVGSPVNLGIASLADLELQGEIRAVIPQANAISRTFPVKVKILNADSRIGVGMLATVILPIGTASEVVIVPKDAIVSQGTERVIFVIGDDDSVRKVAVRTGSSQGLWIAVEGEVQPADRVITRGNERVFPRQKVTAERLEYELP
jgi:RND family efflux transporter MFP subunit